MAPRPAPLARVRKNRRIAELSPSRYLSGKCPGLHLSSTASGLHRVLESPLQLGDRDYVSSSLPSRCKRPRYHHSQNRKSCYAPGTGPQYSALGLSPIVQAHPDEACTSRELSDQSARRLSTPGKVR